MNNRHLYSNYGVVRNINWLNDRVVECRIKSDSTLNHTPGQYIAISIGGHEKYFSIADVSEKSFNIVAQLITGTSVANYFDKIRVGDTLHFTAPIGNMPLKTQEHVTVIATGTGIVPIYEIAIDYLSSSSESTVHILFGLHDETNTFYLDKLRILEKKYSRCTVITTLAKPGPNWRGQVGHPSDYLESITTAYPSGRFYVCGRQTTVMSIIGKLKEMNIKSRQIYTIS